MISIAAPFSFLEVGDRVVGRFYPVAMGYTHHEDENRDSGLLVSACRWL
jgi:hypothetical protein